MWKDDKKKKSEHEEIQKPESDGAEKKESKPPFH
jgi:hypothetical protein